MNLSLPTHRPLRILVTRADRIGDLVLSTPVFSALRRKFPEAWIACLTFCENREIVEGNPFLDEVILYDKAGSERGGWGNGLFAARLAQKKFDVVIHLHATNRMHLVTWLARLPLRIGYDRKCGWTLTHRYADLKKEGTRHEAEYNFDLLRDFGIEPPAALEPHFPVSGRMRESLRLLLDWHRVPGDRPWVVLHPAASCPSKIWPAERFGDLANRISERYGAALILIGKSGDGPTIESVRRRAQVPLYDLSGRLSLGMLGALLADCGLLISNDSGPVHIAAALSTPVISLFGRKQPGLSARRWGPLGKDASVLWRDVGCVECLAHRCQIGFLCLDAISVDDVMKEVDRLNVRLGEAFAFP